MKDIDNKKIDEYDFDNSFIEKLSYEESYSIMQDILEKLENGNIKLDESLRLYEKGILLYRHCNKIIDEAHLKITMFNENNEEIEF